MPVYCDELTDLGRERLTGFLEYLENATLEDTAMNLYSGGYANAEYDWVDEDYIYITLKWGIWNDTEKVVHTENYKVQLPTLNGHGYTNRKCYESMEDA